MKARSQSFSIPPRHSRRPSTQRNVARWTKAAILRELKKLANPKVRAKMAYFGVNVPKSLGVSAPVLHTLAKRIGKDHRLAAAIWASGVQEARIVATWIGEPERGTTAQLQRRARDVDSWDVVDGAGGYPHVH